MFKTAGIVAFGLLGSIHSAAAWRAQFGVISTLVPVPDSGVGSGGIGCGLLARVTSDDRTEVYPYFFARGEQPTDECPAADRTPFCKRWGGCPRTFNWSSHGAPVYVTVMSDNADGTMRVKAGELSGRTYEQNCPIRLVDEGVKGGVRRGWIWDCHFR